MLAFVYYQRRICTAYKLYLAIELIYACKQINYVDLCVRQELERNESAAAAYSIYPEAFRTSCAYTILR